MKLLLNCILCSSLVFLFSTSAKAQCEGANFACGVDLVADWQLASEVISVCEGTPFEVSNGTTSPDIDYYIWSWGDEQKDTVFNTDNQTHTYTFDGDINCSGPGLTGFTITLEIYRLCENGGISCHNQSAPVTVSLKPRASFESPEEICISDAVQFSNGSCFAESFLWDFGDGVTSTEESPVHDYSQPGNYTVRLTAFNDCVPNGVTTTRRVRVVDIPESSFIFQSAPADQCEGSIISFDVTANQWTNTRWEIVPTDTLQWCFVDTNMTRFTRNIEILFKQDGVYDFLLVGSNICEEDSRQEETIEIFEEAFIQTRNTITACESVTLSSSDILVSQSGSITSYEWIFTNASESVVMGENFSDVTFEESGTITLKIESPCGDKQAQTQVVVINVDEITLGDNASEVCQSDSTLQLLATPIGGQWSGVNSTADAAVTEEGIVDLTQLDIGQRYSFTYTVGVGECEKTSDPFEIELLAGIGVSLETKEVCEPESVNMSELVAYEGDIQDYTWKFKGSTFSDPNPSFDLEAGENLIKIVIEGKCGKDSAEINLVVPDEVDFQIESIPNPLCTNQSTYQLNASPSGGRWSGIGNDAVTEDGLVDLSILTPDTYRFQYTIGSGVCEKISDPVEINVLGNLDVELMTKEVCEPTFINMSELVSYEGDIDSYTWTFAGNTFSEPRPSFDLEAGENLIKIVVEGICGKDSAEINLFVPDEFEFEIEAVTDTLCAGQGIYQLTASPEGGIWSGVGNNAVSQDGVIDLSALQLGTYRFQYTLGSGICERVSDPISVRVFGSVGVELAGVDPACDFLELSTADLVNFTLQDEITRYEWIYNDSIQSTEATPNFSFDPISTNLTVKVYSSCSEPQIATIPIEVQSSVPIEIAPISNPLCTGSSPDTLSVNVEGGVWRSNNGGITDEILGIFDPSTVAPGFYEITYEFLDGACDNVSDPIRIEVVASATATIQDAIVCTDSEPTTLIVDQSGGTWRGEGTDASGIFDPTGLATNEDYSVFYDFVDDNGCEVSTEGRVTVEALPILNRDTFVQLCLSDIDVDLVGILNYNPTPSGGTTVWSGDGIINEDGIFNSSSLTPNTYSVTMTYQRNDCEVSVSSIIEVIEAQALSLTPDTIICISADTLRLQANLSGGKWSGTGIDENTGLVDLLVGEGGDTFSYTYTYQAGTSCEQIENVSVKIVDLSNVVEAGDNSSTCEGENSFQLQGASPLNGLWSGEFIDANSGLINLQQLQRDSLYTYTYTIESEEAAACEAADTRTFILHSNPVAAFDTSNIGCIDVTFQLDNQSSENAIEFDWDFGDGNNSEERDPFHTYRNADTYTLSLRSTTAFGCVDETSLEVFVTEPPVAAFDLQEKEGCAPFEVLTSNGSSGFDIQQTWCIAGDTILGAELTSFFIDSIATDSMFHIVLKVINQCGVRTDQDSVLVRPYPVVDFGIKQEEQCSPSSVVVSNTTIGNPDNFVWNDSRGLTSTESEPNFPPYTTTDTLVSIYTISLTASNECGTRSLDKEIIVLPPDVEAFIEERDTLVGCQPFALNIESFSTPNASVKWTILNEQNVEIAGSNDKVLVDTLQDAGFYTVLLFASQCGTDADTAYVNVLPQPLVSFETDRPYSCVNDSLQFINTSDQVNEVRWNFGDGTGSTMQSPSHFFDSAGIYLVTLQASSLLNACPARTQGEIEVFDNPVADMTPSVFSGCLPLEVSFLNNSVGENITTYTWNFNDTCGSSFSNVLEPTYVFECSGQYSATLEVTDARGCSAETSIDNIFVFEPPVADFSIAQESYCLGQDTVRLQNTSSIDAISFQWVVEGDTIAQRNLAYVPTTVGSVEVELIAFNNNGCTASSRQSFEVIASPIAQFTPNITAGCEDLTVQFNNDSQFANNYSWDFNDGNTSSQTNPLNEFLNAGTFRVQLIANSLNACRADTTSLDIEVYPKPLADFDFPVDESCGAPKDVTFSNTSTGQDSDLWMFGDGQQSRQKNPTHRFHAAGQFQTILMVENRFGCADTIQKTVDIFGQPFADFEFSTLPEGCEDFQISLLNLSTQSLRYIWNVESFGRIEAINPSLTFTEVGKYDVELIAIYNDKCQDTLKMEDAITVHQSPIPSFTYQADFDENEIGEVQFINQSQLADRYRWDFGDGQSSNLENPLHVYNINRFIDAKLTAYNDNNGVFTCVADTIVPISPEWVTTFYTPNAFAPSYGASEVGVFQPKGLGIQAYEISVYSPFGKLVWHSTTLEENSPSEAWNGQYLNEGEDLPQGAYTWFARVTYLSGNTIERTGTVTILR